MDVLRRLALRLEHHRGALASASLAVGALVAMAIAQRKHRAAARILEDAARRAEEATRGLKPAFARRVKELAEFRERVGHADVPLGSASGSKLVPQGLGKWVYAQRRRKAEGRMDPAEEAALQAQGFRWQLDPEELDAEEMLGRLRDYKAQHGDCLVPKKFEADPLLGAWVAACRRKADPLLNGGQSALPETLRDALDKAGFAWEPERRCGSAFMRGLRAYGEAFTAGKPPPDEQWCETQRVARRQGKLSEQRVEYLNKYGFDWGESEAAGA